MYLYNVEIDGVFSRTGPVRPEARLNPVLGRASKTREMYRLQPKNPKPQRLPNPRSFPQLLSNSIPCPNSILLFNRSIAERI